MDPDDVADVDVDDVDDDPDTWDDDADDDDFLPNATSADDLLHDTRYMRAVADMGTRLTRILSGNQDVTVNIESTGLAPAWQQNSKIALEPAEIKPMCVNPKDEREVLPMLTGFLLHEYGHLDFTPRPDNATWRKCEQDTRQRVKTDYTQKHGPARLYDAHGEADRHVSMVRHTLNVLEDQRQELLVSTKYPRARSYFRLLLLRSMLRFMREKGTLPVQNYGLYYGRRHIIPASILKAIRAGFAAKYGEDTAQWLEGQVNDYTALSLTTNTALEQAWNIADAVWSRMRVEMQNDRPDCLSTGHIGSRTSKREQDSLTKQGQQTLAQVDEANAKREQAGKDKGQEQGKEQAQAGASGEKQDEGEQAQAGGQGEQDEKQDATASSGQSKGIEQSGQGTPTDGPTDDSGETAETAQGHAEGGESHGAAQGHGGEHDDLTADELEQALGEGLRDLVENMLDKAYEKVAKETGEASAEIRARIFGAQAQKLAHLLSDISMDLAPTDFPRERSGRLDMRRIPALVASGGSEPRIFHRKQEDLRDEAVMGVHVIIDRSGSMSHSIKTAMDAAHTLARASDLAGHFTKVSTFDTSAKVIKEWTDATWKPYGGCGGTTNVQPVLDNMWTDFRAINRAKNFRNNVAFIVTDGDFDDSQKAEQTFRELTRKGVHIFIIGIGTDPEVSTYEGGTYRTHPYPVEGTFSIKSVQDLEPKMRGLMKRLAVNIARDVHRAHA